ncbi:MAG: alpha/beta hydrolase [Gammaproteobacteria bacterium]|nr:alpha/beta hydrolase [Gammaproteobacteria bacterium]
MPDGTAVHYRLWQTGRTSRGLIVLLHGMASNLTRWSEFVEHTALKQEWDILRLDLRGHGESIMHGKISARIWSDDLIELLDAENCERAIVIGHSLGAHLALQFADRFPNRIRGLVLIDPAFPQALRGSWPWLRRLRPLLCVIVAIIRVLNALGLHRRHFPRRDLRLWDEKVRTEFLATGKAEEFVRHYSSPFNDFKYLPIGHYLQELIEMMRPLPKPAHIRAPMLVLLSRSVTYTDPAVTDRLLADLPHIERATIDAYHWPLTEKPVEVRGEIEGWITRQFLRK